MKRSVIIFFLCLSFAVSAGAESGCWSVNWQASTRLAGATGQYMPFWSRTGEDGILPVKSSGMITAGADALYRDSKGFFFEAGTNLAGVLAMKSPLNPDPVYGMVDRLYVSGGWKMLRMDVGMKPRRGDLGPLSITGGNIIYSGNARNLPGINLSTGWIYFEKGQWVGIRGNLAHYHMIDSRHVKGTMVHDKSVALKVDIVRKVDLMAGFNHYAQWGGVSQTDGPQAQSFKDYVKVFFAKRGDAADSESDRLNVFGNHLGNEWVRLVWHAQPFDMTFQYDKPFEDNSGMMFQNFPDGVWTLKFALKNREAFVTDVIYEFINTTWQSGDRHDRPATEEEIELQDPSDPHYGKVVLGGQDNYFNNYPYRSGWTHFGRSIGLPLMTPSLPGIDGRCIGIVNNRVRGHHVGISGNISHKIPYRLKATFTENFGTYSDPFVTKACQLSMAFEADLVREFTRLPVEFSAGAYADVGRLYPSSFGLTLRITYNGSASGGRIK